MGSVCHTDAMSSSSCSPVSHHANARAPLILRSPIPSGKAPTHGRTDPLTPSPLLVVALDLDCRVPQPQKSSEVLLNLVLPTRRRATPAATDARRRGGSCSPPLTAPSCSRGDAPRRRRRPTETTTCLHLLQIPTIDNHMYRS
jgi:hypothetical protein